MISKVLFVLLVVLILSVQGFRMRLEDENAKRNAKAFGCNLGCSFPGGAIANIGGKCYEACMNS